MKRLLKLLVMSSMMSFCVFGQEAGMDITQEPDYIPLPKRGGFDFTKGEAPEGYPFKMVDPTEAELKAVKDLEKRPLKVRIKNISDKPAVANGEKSGCPCIELVKGPAAQTIQPGETFTIEYTLDAKKLRLGDFDREIYFYAKDFPRVRIMVTGSVEKMLEYHPRQGYDLGEFTGQYPFEREFEIESMFADDALSLPPTVASEAFDIRITKTAPKHFKVKLKAKTPFKRGKLRESIKIPVTGVPNYGPIQLGVVGTVKPMELAVQGVKQTVELPRQLAGVAPSVTFEVVPYVAVHGKKRGYVQRTNPDFVRYSPVAEEELKGHPLDDIKTWEEVRKALSIKDLPEGAKLETAAFERGVRMKVTFPADYFNAERDFTALNVVYMDDVKVDRVAVHAK